MSLITRYNKFDKEEGITLRAKGITSIDHLWAEIGKDIDNGLSNVASAPPKVEIAKDYQREITAKRLVEVLSDQGDRDFALPDGPEAKKRLAYKSEQLRLWLKRVFRFFRNNWLEWTIALLLVSLLMLWLQARSYAKSVVIASHSLESGRIIEASSDLYSARFPSDVNCFNSASQLQGLMLTRAMRAGEPIRFEHVQRLQLVATKEIAAGQVILTDAVALAWSPYKKSAFVNSSQVLNRKSQRAIKSGEVILQEFVDP
jgi:flagella basal body P-ring formation protein FlgA